MLSPERPLRMRRQTSPARPVRRHQAVVAPRPELPRQAGTPGRRDFGKTKPPNLFLQDQCPALKCRRRPLEWPPRSLAWSTGGAVSAPSRYGLGPQARPLTIPCRAKISLFWQ